MMLAACSQLEAVLNILLYKKDRATIKLYSSYLFQYAMTTEVAATPPTPPISCPDERQIRDALRGVIDPEVGINIIALGLVYRIDIAPDRLLIEMTMTSPACPMGEMIVDDVRATLARLLPDTLQLDVNLVWQPPWNPSMMDEAAKQHFGWAPE